MTPTKTEQVIIDNGGNSVVNGFRSAARFVQWMTASPTSRVSALYELNSRRLTGRSAYRGFLNVTRSQVEIGRRRAAEKNLSGRVDLRLGSATDVPFEAGSFDRVVALESACHFDTRQKFFEEAFRVLRPGGVLATADLVPRPAPRRKTLAARLERFGYEGLHQNDHRAGGTPGAHHRGGAEAR
ncbi:MULTISPECIES: class I SAM-dependent methyltransferase [unclassified Streptomyces]|uniref:class I SAM-dependent methyltransferase n=1 Tax=unclassified Streptomyces TaxID=2593676 RepID=UPI00336A2315